MDDPESENELNGDFGVSEYDDNSDDDNDEHITKAKSRPIKNTKNNKASSLAVTKAPTKETHTSKINEEDNDDTMDNSYNKYEEEDEGTTLYSKMSTPHNTSQLINSND